MLSLLNTTRLGQAKGKNLSHCKQPVLPFFWNTPRLGQAKGEGRLGQAKGKSLSHSARCLFLNTTRLGQAKWKNLSHCKRSSFCSFSEIQQDQGRPRGKFYKTGHRGSALFSLFSGQQSPYMHPSAELYIPVSDVHPSLAMQITVFSLLRGIKNLEKPQKNEKTKRQNPSPSIQNLEKPKNQKKTKRQNLCPSIWHGVSSFGFFVLGFSR